MKQKLAIAPIFIIAHLALTTEASTERQPAVSNAAKHQTLQQPGQPATTRIKEGLQSVITRTARIEDAARTIVEAGKSRNREFVPTLKEVVDASSKSGMTENRYFEVCFFALRALWELGEPKSYFLENVKAHERNKTIAYWSAFILAREPDKSVLKALKQIDEELKGSFSHEDNVIRNAITQAETVRFSSERLASIEKVTDKIRYLLKIISADCFVYPSDDNNPYSYWNHPGSGQHPLRAWARQDVLRLSKVSPRLVAETIFNINLKTDLGYDRTYSPFCPPFGNVQYRRFAIRFITDEAQAALAELEKQEALRKKPSRRVRKD